MCVCVCARARARASVCVHARVSVHLCTCVCDSIFECMRARPLAVIVIQFSPLSNVLELQVKKVVQTGNGCCGVVDSNALPGLAHNRHGISTVRKAVKGIWRAKATAGPRPQQALTNSLYKKNIK